MHIKINKGITKPHVVRIRGKTTEIEVVYGYKLL